MAVIQSGAKAPTKLAILAYGAQGTAKSTTGLTMLELKRQDGRPYRVLYIDTEGDGISSYIPMFEERGVDSRNLLVVRTQSLSEVVEIVHQVRDGRPFFATDEFGAESPDPILDADGEVFRPDGIVVDSLSVLYTAKQAAMTEFSKKRAMVKARSKDLTGLEKDVMIESAGMELKDWGAIGIAGQNLILDLMSSGCDFYVTCREKEETESVKDPSDGQIKSRKTGRTLPDGFKGTAYNVGTVLHLTRDPDSGEILGIVEDKDRTLVHAPGDLLTSPSLTDWQVALDRNKSVNSSAPRFKNTLLDAIKAETAAEEAKAAQLEAEYDASKAVMSKDELKAAIRSTISSLPQLKKAKAQAAVKDAGLAGNIDTMSEDELGRFLDILKNFK